MSRDRIENLSKSVDKIWADCTGTGESWKFRAVRRQAPLSLSSLRSSPPLPKGEARGFAAVGWYGADESLNFACGVLDAKHRDDKRA